jgi:hypothetical protein
MVWNLLQLLLAGLERLVERLAVGDRVIVLDSGADWWARGGVIAALLTVLVALFKDEFWNWRHGSKLTVVLFDERHWGDLKFRLRNESRRTPARQVSVRVIELEPHPFERTVGTKWVDHVMSVDVLLSRPTGETRYDIAPGAEVIVPFTQLRDGWTDDEAAVALMPWAPKPPMPSEDQAGLLVLPSLADRQHWADQLPGLEESWGAPAMARIEVAGTNVAARYYTVKIWRDPEPPPAGQRPDNPSFKAGVFRTELVSGKASHNPAQHASSYPLSPPAQPSGDG